MNKEVPTANPGDLADLDGLRARVRADRRTVTAPLLVLGAAVVLHAVAWIVSSGAAPRHLVLLFYWPLAGAAVLFALWAHANRLARRDGVGGGPRSYRPVAVGYLVSLPVLALLFIPAYILGVFGPLLWPAAILWAVAARQHSPTLRAVAKGLAMVGTAQLLLALIGSAARGSATGWVSYSLDVLAGLGLLALGARRAASR